MSEIYNTLDNLIINSITHSRCSPLNDRACINEAAQLERTHGGEDFRYIDRRLQALRKQGLIQYLSKLKAPNGKAGWYLTAE